MSDPDDDPEDALPFDDEEKPAPPRPRGGSVSPRSLFERESEERRTVTVEDPSPGPARGMPLAAIFLLVLLAAVAGYVVMRSLFSPGTPPAPERAAVTAPAPPQPSADHDASREDYFDPLAPVGGDATADAPPAPSPAGGGGSEMVPVEEPPKRPFEEPGAAAQAGDLPRAARLWAASLAVETDPGTWTLQISANCQTAALPGLLRRLSTGGEEAFLLPVRINGQDCYRLCRGVYRNREDAEASIPRLPSISPPPQPRAVPLDAMLTR